MRHSLSQDGVALEADGVDVALRLQHLIKLRHGEGRVSAKDPHQVTAPIPRYDRGQNVLPAVSAADIALAQGATLKIAELVEYEQRVIALAAKVAVSCRANSASGMLVMPLMTEAGFWLGGGYGRGALISKGETLDYYSAIQGSAGLQAGAQQYSYVVFFMTDEALNTFRTSNGWEAAADSASCNRLVWIGD